MPEPDPSPNAATQGSVADGTARSDYAWLKSYPDAVSWDKAYQATPVGAIIDRAVSRHGDKICTNFLGKPLTYANVGQLVDRAAKGLQGLGIKKGDKVGLLLPNCPTFIVYYFAAAKIGAVVVNYNPLYTAEELEFQITDSQTDTIVTLDLKLLFGKVEEMLNRGVLKRAIVGSFTKLLPMPKALAFRLFKNGDLAAVARSPAKDKIIDESTLVDNDGRFEPAEIVPEEDIAVLQYTGGTTGTPKGAMLTHANITINVQQVSDWAPELRDADERIMAVLPFFHVFAMTVVMNYGIWRAAELVIMPRFVLDDAMKLITKTKPTVMPGVPTLFNAIINHQKLDSYDLSSLKFCLSGGAALPLEVKNRFEDVDGMQAGRGLRAVGNLAGAHLEPADRSGEGEFDRPAAAADDPVAARCR